MRTLPVLALLAGCTTYLTPGGNDLAARSVEPCVEDAIVALVNGSDGDALRAVGVHSRAASSLASTRAGADDVLGTADDLVFESLDQIDAVPQVGDSALDALEAAVAGSCEPVVDVVAACTDATALELANTLDAEALKDLGVYSTGANNLVAARPFADLTAVDDVSGIGPSSMDALLGWAEGSCRAQPVFSPQAYWDSHLARVTAEIDAARDSIDIAMYSFSDGGVKAAVFDAAARGVSIRAILDGASEDRLDPAGTLSAQLEDAGIEVRWVNKVMHHKFAIVDGPRTDLAQAEQALLMSGSGNWSYSAGTKYDEDTLFLRDEKLTLSFQQEFEHLWTHGRPVEWNESIVSVEGLVITDEDIAQAEGSEARFTSDNFRVYESSRYGWTFARQGHDANVHDRIAELILSAEDSVWIASGHMRSRPISEAVLAAVAANPELDVRVYLDGQEYTSAWYSGTQQNAFEDCMAAAVDADDIEDCREDGMHWGYPLHQAGVPVRFKWSAYRWDYHYAEQLHHKLVIVDGDTVASGSYNYSPNAEFDTFENLIVLERSRYGAAVDAYVARYEELWETRRDEVDGFMDELAYGADDVDIVFPGMAMTWDEVDLAKDLIQDACPDVDSDDFRDNPDDHHTCTRG